MATESTKVLIEKINDQAHTIELNRQEKQTLELKLSRAESGNEALQERIKVKDGIIADLKDVIQTLKPTKQKDH